MERYMKEKKLTEIQDSGYTDLKKGVIKIKRFYRDDYESIGDEVAGILNEVLDYDTLQIIKEQL